MVIAPCSPVPLGEAAGVRPLPVGARRRGPRRARRRLIGVHMTFAPMCDVARDPRWGRIVERPGEDPFVGAALALGQGGGLFSGDARLADGMAACAKHFAGYGAVMAGREYASTDMSERTLPEVYLPAFAAAVEAGVASVMPAFTDLGGVPMTAHKKLLQDYLRGELGFDGVVTFRISREVTRNIRHKGRVHEVPSYEALATIVTQLAIALFPTHYGKAELFR